MGSMLLCNLTTDTAVTAGGDLPLGSAIHGYGNCIKQNGNAIQLRSSGYYQIGVSAIMEVTADADVVLMMYKNGIAVTGAAASATPAAAGATVNLSFPWIVKKGCCCEDDVITFEVSAAGTILNSIVEVVKL